MSQYESYYSGGGGGGGFLQGGSPFSATGSPGGAQRSEASMSLRPITAAQYAKATQAHGEAPWLLDGNELGQVTLVGQVISLQQHTTNHIYSIEDGTGRAEARHWVGSSGNAAAEAEKWSGIEEGSYVRLSGFLKSFGAKKYINVSYMRPIDDFNEIYFHLLETITTTLTLERGPHYSLNAKAGGGGSSAYQPNSNTMDERDEYSGLPPLQQQIIRYIMSQNVRDGVHVKMIAREIGKPDTSADEISAALDQLMDNGTLYNTVDESHFTISR